MVSSPGGNNGIQGKYRLLAELGQGGTSNVYLAVARGPRGFNKLVVLKLLKDELAGEPEFRNMFLNEARLAARLNHPNVVQTNEVFEEDGRPIIVMEYLEGATLSRVVSRSRQRTQPMPLAMHLRIICEALSGLHYAHELRDYDGTPLGVVHRDMTPQNIFVSFDGKISLLDFGIAKLSGSLAETQAGVVKGKLRYMPPEQVLGEPVDRRTDIFAVGVVLWEAIARERMWKGLADATILHNIVNGQIPSPRTARADIPEALELICMKALAAAKENRYATAAELQLDLEEWLAGHTVSTRTIGHFVSALFGDTRAKTREVIESQLAHLTPEPLYPGTLYGPSGFRIPSLTQSGFPNTGSSSQPELEPLRGLARRRWLVISGLILLFVAVGLFLGRSTWDRPTAENAPPREESLPTPSAVPPVPVRSREPEPAAAAPARVSIRVAASPPKAKLYLDEQPLPVNPYSISVPAGSTPHAIRAEMVGYTIDQKLVTFDKDLDVSLKLYPLKASGRAQAAGRASGSLPTSAAPAVVPKGSASEPAAKSEPNCNPPYSIDENGIRRLRAECLNSAK